MAHERAITLQTKRGDSLTVLLEHAGDRAATVLWIEGIPHHLERMDRRLLLSEYQVDADPDYHPQVDQEGYCYIMVPFSG